jgi:hypothetical protein
MKRHTLAMVLVATMLSMHMNALAMGSYVLTVEAEDFDHEDPRATCTTIVNGIGPLAPVWDEPGASGGQVRVRYGAPQTCYAHHYVTLTEGVSYTKTFWSPPANTTGCGRFSISILPGNTHLLSTPNMCYGDGLQVTTNVTILTAGYYELNVTYWHHNGTNTYNYAKLDTFRFQQIP